MSWQWRLTAGEAGGQLFQASSAVAYLQRSKIFKTFTCLWTRRGPETHNGFQYRLAVKARAGTESHGGVAQQQKHRREQNGDRGMPNTHDLNDPPVADAASRRRSHQRVKRSRTVRFDLTEDEYAELAAAATQAGLAKGAYAAESALAAARGAAAPSDSPLREALVELMRAAGLVRRIGTNLNQAVAKLNATGQRSGDLIPYAAESIRRARMLDEAAEQLRKALP